MCEEGEGEEGEAGQDRAARHHRLGEYRFIAVIVVSIMVPSSSSSSLGHGRPTAGMA